MTQKIQDEGVVSLNPKQESVDAFTSDVERRFERTTHNKGRTSWWSDQTGFNHSAWSGSSDDYRALLVDVALNEFELDR